MKHVAVAHRNMHSCAHKYGHHSQNTQMYKILNEETFSPYWVSGVSRGPLRFTTLRGRIAFIPTLQMQTYRHGEA